MIKMALFGCGRIGRLHAQNIVQNQGAELVQVYDVHQLSADPLTTLHNCEAALAAEAMYLTTNQRKLDFRMGPKPWAWQKRLINP